MPTALDILLARTRGDLPKVPNPALSLPIPLAPVTGIGPLSDDTTAAFAALNPEPVPPSLAPAPPLDTNFINNYSGAAPVAPTLQEPSFLDKLSTALLGFGAGVQGRGPQFIESVREERNRPIREYQRQLEQFNERRTRGTEIATRQQEREQDRAQRAAENQYEREYNQWLKKTGVRDETAKAVMRQAFDIQKIQEKARADADEQAKKDRAQQERDARLIARDFGKVGAKPEIALELGRYYSGLTDKIGAKAAEFESAQARLTEARIRKASGGGGTGGGVSAQTAKLVQEFNTVRENLIGATARGDAKGQKDLRARLSQLVKRLAGRSGVEVGYGAGQWPYLKVSGQLQGAQEPAQQPTGGIPPMIAAPSQGQMADPLRIR